jgi:hypothetical protein
MATMAGIDIWLATETDITTAFAAIEGQMVQCGEYKCGSWTNPGDGSISCVGDQTGVCSMWDAYHYRYNGLLALRDNHIACYRTCSDAIDWGTGTKPFHGGLNIPFAKYIVYGKCETFTVTADGAYSFRVFAKDGGWMFIDGKLIANSHRTLGNFTGETIGEVDAQFVGSDHTYQTNNVSLTAGTHTLEIYYSHHSDGTQQQMIAHWQAPGSADMVVIPASAFGEQCPASPSAAITSVKINGEATTLAVQGIASTLTDDITLTGEFVNAPSWAANVTYVWNKGDLMQTTVETTEPTVTYKYTECPSQNFPYYPTLSVKYSDRYQTSQALSNTAFDCAEGTVRPAMANASGLRVASADKIVVYNAQGKVVVNTANVDVLKGLSRGVYMVQTYKNGSFLEKQRFVQK